MAAPDALSGLLGQALPFGLSQGGALWLALAFFGAGLVRGYSGFGFSALVVAAAGLVTHPLNLVAVVTALEAAMSLQVWRRARGAVDWPRVRQLMAGAVIGLPIGLWLLTGLSEDAARAAISGYVLAMCAVLWAGWRLPAMLGPGATAGVGLLSGISNGPGMGGLPVAAVFAAQPMPAAAFRATLIAYFPLLDLYSAPLYVWHGLVSWDTLRAIFVALPLAALGNRIGGRHFFATGPAEFRRFAILLLAVLSALGLGRAVL